MIYIKELTFFIFSHLPSIEIVNCHTICKYWYSILSEANGKIFWRWLYCFEFTQQKHEFELTFDYKTKCLNYLKLVHSIRSSKYNLQSIQHKGFIWNLDLRHNELASASTNTVKLWTLCDKNGQKKRNLCTTTVSTCLPDDSIPTNHLTLIHKNQVGGIQFYDDSLLITGDDTFSIHIWNRAIVGQAQTNTIENPIKRNKIHSGFIWDLIVSSTKTTSPKQPFILTASQDASIIMSDFETCIPLQYFQGHCGTVYSIRFLKDHNSVDNSNLLISGDLCGVIKMWDIRTQYCYATLLNKHSQSVRIVRSYRNYFLSASLDQTIQIWDPLYLNSPIKIFQNNQEIYSLTTIGKEIIVGGKDGSLNCFDWNDNQNKEKNEIVSIHEHKNTVRSIVNNDQYLISAESSGVIHIRQPFLI